MNNFLSLLQTSPTPLLADGAMGTLLHSRGIPFERCFDELNLSNPAVVAGIHTEYMEAGAQILLTNTFGANRFKLAKHGLEVNWRRSTGSGLNWRAMPQPVQRSWRAILGRWECTLHPLAGVSQTRHAQLSPVRWLL